MNLNARTITNWKTKVLTALVMALSCSFGAELFAQAAIDPEFESMREKAQITTEEGAQIPLDARYRDESGKEVTLGDYFSSGRPVILSMVYFSCPSLCNLQADGQTRVLRDIEWNPGDKFEVVVVSMDHRDDPAKASTQKDYVLSNYQRPQSADGWHFLTGDEKEIRRLSQAIGFGFEWSETQGEYMHSAGLFITTPDGRVSRVLNGVHYEPETVRMALNEAAEGNLGSVWEHFTMLCVGWDPETGKYSVTAMAAMRIGAVLTVLLLLFVILIARSGRKNAPEPTAALGIQS